MTGKNGSHLIDKDLRKKLEAAAKSVGMSREQLLEALQSDINPSEGVEFNDLTVSMTVGDVGQALHLKMERTPESARAEFYRGLTRGQQGSLVTHLTHIGFAPASIALEFGIPETEVRRYWEEYSDKLGQKTTGIRLQTLVGQLQSKAETISEMAMRDNDSRLAWQIQKDMVKLLQDLDVVERAVHRSEVTHKMELSEADAQELDLMLKLREKKKQAKEELKQIQADVMDEEFAGEEVGGE